MKDNLIVMSVTVSPELAHLSRVFAAKKGISRSALVRMAIEEYIKNPDGKDGVKAIITLGYDPGRDAFGSG